MTKSRTIRMQFDNLFKQNRQLILWLCLIMLMVIAVLLFSKKMIAKLEMDAIGNYESTTTNCQTK